MSDRPTESPRERPILFKPRLVRAILEGRKTETRRLLNPQLNSPYGVPGDRLYVREPVWLDREEGRFYVYEATPNRVYDSQGPAWYSVANEGPPSVGDFRKVPSIHLPRHASRLLLEVTGVRVERLHEITEAGAIAEGVANDGTYWLGGPHRVKGTPTCHPTARDAFASLWDSINGDAATMATTTTTKPPKSARPGASWDANPWVRVVQFRVIATRPPCIQRLTAVVA